MRSYGRIFLVAAATYGARRQRLKKPHARCWNRAAQFAFTTLGSLTARHSGSVSEAMEILSGIAAARGCTYRSINEEPVDQLKR
jgi:hypothetical protein